ncbi:hypothetical protein GWI33_002188 [Rhynchophorus ferrugineus]|uniref:Uncharacterized protein n=1 Tax=Rhynchophorus ferrugineus TaxID=354439 RepID=A0A834IMP6_RHYFE|nr:hypothetical protein GWI33_002188 [Rhynchophorus ferrugineus]
MSTEDGERSGCPKEISTERVHHTIHEYLGMRMLCAKWVTRELTFDQKQRRVDDSEQCLIKHGSIISFRSSIGSHPSELHTMNPLQSVGKCNIRLASIIGPFEGRYRRKTAAFEEKEGGASPRQCTASKFPELGFELLPRPPYSADLIPSDYFLYSDFKGMLTGKKSTLNAETEVYSEAKNTSYYKNSIEKLEFYYGRPGNFQSTC